MPLSIHRLFDSPHTPKTLLEKCSTPSHHPPRSRLFPPKACAPVGEFNFTIYLQSSIYKVAFTVRTLNNLLEKFSTPWALVNSTYSYLQRRRHLSSVLSCQSSAWSSRKSFNSQGLDCSYLNLVPLLVSESAQ